MTFTKILCPIDFSDGAKQAMRLAVRLANEARAELVLLHAWHAPPALYAGEVVYPPIPDGAMIEDARRALADALGEAHALGAAKVTTVLAKGIPWTEIVGLLEKQPFDLCVMGTHGRTGLSRVFLGSVAEKVVRHAPCSVMVVRPDGRAPAPFKHVLCPTDLSHSAVFAAELAARVAAKDGRLQLLHVIEMPTPYGGRMRIEDFTQDLDRRSSAALEAEAARLGQRFERSVETSARVGYAGAQTLAALEEDPTIDLVVMGSHGRTGIARVLLGSVAEKVVRHATCPVLVARKRG